MLLWRYYVAGNNKTYLDVRVKCQIFFSDFNKIWIVDTYFHESFQFQILLESVQWDLHWYLRTD